MSTSCRGTPERSSRCWMSSLWCLQWDDGPWGCGCSSPILRTFQPWFRCSAAFDALVDLGHSMLRTTVTGRSDAIGTWHPTKICQALTGRRRIDSGYMWEDGYAKIIGNSGGEQRLHRTWPEEYQRRSASSVGHSHRWPEDWATTEAGTLQTMGRRQKGLDSRCWRC